MQGHGTNFPNRFNIQNVSFSDTTLVYFCINANTSGEKDIYTSLLKLKVGVGRKRNRSPSVSETCQLNPYSLPVPYTVSFCLRKRTFSILYWYINKNEKKKLWVSIFHPLLSTYLLWGTLC